MINNDPMMEKYAEVAWCPADIKALNEHWSDEKCQEMLFKISSYLEDRLIELGWQVMEDLLDLFTEDEEEDNEDA